MTDLDLDDLVVRAELMDRLPTDAHRRVLRLAHAIETGRRLAPDAMAPMLDEPELAIESRLRDAELRLRELAEVYAWHEPTATARYQAGSLVSYSGPLTLIPYHRGIDPDELSVEVVCLCPPCPIGKKLEVESRAGLWRHVPAEG